MWLLNTTNFTLEYFRDDRELRYVILSHRWTDEEISRSDLQSGHDVAGKRGWQKIVQACRQALSHDYNYIWIDTCCIDDASSAELSEAINSMFRWYRDSNVCYVYLQDVFDTGENGEPSLPGRLESSIRASEWFKRGWTLQELIAPRCCIFFDANWQPLGTRDSHKTLISEITGVPKTLLEGNDLLERYSVAQRMSWASRRRTTRGEDTAYSLLGLFDVNMPMLYGEGETRAFARLQAEIIKQSTDQTIFAWKNHQKSMFRGLFAHSPAEFAECGSIVAVDQPRPKQFQDTQLGLQITLTTRVLALDTYEAVIEAVDERYKPAVPIKIALGVPATNRFVNLLGRCPDFESLTDPEPRPKNVSGAWVARQIVVPRKPFPGKPLPSGLLGFVIRNFRIVRNDDVLTLGHGIDIVARPGTWKKSEDVVALERGTVGSAIVFTIRDTFRGAWAFLKIGFDEDFRPCAWIAPISSSAWIAAFRVATIIEEHELVSFYEARLPSPARPPSASGLDVLDQMLLKRIDPEEDVGSFNGTYSLSSSDHVLTPQSYRGSRIEGLSINFNHLMLRIARGPKTGRYTWIVDFELDVMEARLKPENAKPTTSNTKSRFFHRSKAQTSSQG